MFSSALYLPLVTAQAVVAPPKAINTFCCLKYCVCVFKHDALIFQTPSICVRSSAMRAAAGPAPWPPPSDADVVPRQKLVETPVHICHLILSLTPNNWNSFVFQEVPCATIQKEGEIWAHPDVIEYHEHSTYLTCCLHLISDSFCSRSARLHLWEALQQETVVWPTQVWRAVLYCEYFIVGCIVPKPQAVVNVYIKSKKS